MATDPFTNGDLAYLQEHELAPMAWSPLGGGKLFGDDYSALHTKLTQMGRAHSVDAGAMAIAWLLAHPAGIIPIIGTNNMTRIAALAKADTVEMDRQSWFELYAASIGRNVA